VEKLNESLVLYKQDQFYRRQGQYIIIAQIESLVPLHTTLEPRIWGGGNSDFTWKILQRFYSRHPLSRNGQFPQHYYMEYLYDDYVVYVGCPLSNKSWFLQLAVENKILPIQYLDSILIVLQENYSIESMEKQLWKILAHTTLTPLMRLFEIPRERVVFFEKIANSNIATSSDWPFRWRDPVFLDSNQLMLELKEYEKR
jgi:hypothetical protein